MKKTTLSFSIIFLIILSIFSCKKETPNTNTMIGIWESVGSGLVLNIPDSTQYALYDVTKISCILNREAALNELQQALTLKDDTLHLKRGVMSYMFTRSQAIPSICDTKPTQAKAHDVVYNFDVFMQTVKEHYAFMELNTIDWELLYKQQKSRLIGTPTEQELYAVLEETLELLNDNHGFLEATDAFYETFEEKEVEEEEVDSETDLVEYGDFQVADMVTNYFLVEDMTEDSWLIKWGKMENNIGFIQVKAMWLYADLNIPEALIKEHGYVDAYVRTFNAMEEGNYIDLEVKGVNKILDRVMKDLKDTKSIVIDVRFNGGGQDAVNFEILKRFNNKKRHIVNTKLKTGNTYSPLLKLYIDAAEKPYTNPVYILTSTQSGSAAESFAIGTMALPNVKRIGSRTQGALSTALEKTLPNGWAFAVSNEVYMDTQNNSYENIGVPPDIMIKYPKDRQTFFRSVVNDLEADKQVILKAIKTTN